MKEEEEPWIFNSTVDCCLYAQCPIAKKLGVCMHSIDEVK